MTYTSTFDPHSDVCQMLRASLITNPVYQELAKGHTVHARQDCEHGKIFYFLLVPHRSRASEFFRWNAYNIVDGKVLPKLDRLNRNLYDVNLSGFVNHGGVLVQSYRNHKAALRAFEGERAA